MKKSVFLLLIFLCNRSISFAQTFTDTNLPIIIINTDGGATIPDAPRILANMKIIYKGEGIRNFVTDQNNNAFLNYNGRINIEIRGSSSQTLPKKQYGFSTLNSDNITENNVSLLGMPADNDWILNGLGFEPSLIRDYINYNLSRRMGQYASRTVYCEVILNGVYKGLYLLEEKIKQGSERVDVMKITIADNGVPGLTGGYITKADKTNIDDPAAWTMSSSIGTNDVSFIHVQPTPYGVTTLQNRYIKGEFENLSNAAALSDNSLIDGIPSIIDIPSFVDYMIISELGANADAYMYSTYFHKDRNGKLRAGPIWDNNLTFGYDLSIWGFDRSKTNTWQFSNGDNEGAAFWKQLFYNSEFRCSLSRRWNELTRPGYPLNYISIETLINQTVDYIREAEARENALWGTVGDFSLQISKIKTFIQQRIDWMNNQIGSVSNCREVITPSLVISRIMYNPLETTDFPVSSDLEFIEIKNTGESPVDLTGVYFSGTGFVYQFPPYSVILPGDRKILANKSSKFIAKYGFPPSGQFTRNLSNIGQDLTLADGFGNIIDHVSYSSSPPWPDANGNGKYLELTDPASDNNDPGNWIATNNTIVSAESPENDSQLIIYPNPVKDEFHIESGKPVNMVQISDIQGNILMSDKPASTGFFINISSYKTGIYFIKISTVDGFFVRKIVKE